MHSLAVTQAPAEQARNPHLLMSTTQPRAYSSESTRCLDRLVVTAIRCRPNPGGRDRCDWALRLRDKRARPWCAGEDVSRGVDVPRRDGNDRERMQVLISLSPELDLDPLSRPSRYGLGLSSKRSVTLPAPLTAAATTTAVGMSTERGGFKPAGSLASLSSTSSPPQPCARWRASARTPFLPTALRARPVPSYRGSVGCCHTTDVLALPATLTSTCYRGVSRAAAGQKSGLDSHQRHGTWTLPSVQQRICQGGSRCRSN